MEIIPRAGRHDPRTAGLAKNRSTQHNAHNIHNQNRSPPGHRAAPKGQPPQTDRRVDWTTWWLWRGACTRSHPELGREIPQRPWYCVLRHGRVGRRQVFQSTHNTHTTAGWSSPVARQAHNLKVTGSNPVPATKNKAHQLDELVGFFMRGTVTCSGANGWGEVVLIGCSSNDLPEELCRTGHLF